MRRVLPVVLLIVFAACRIEKAPSGRPEGSEVTAADTLARLEEDSIGVARVEAVVRQYYQRLGARDWPAFRELFWPGATITVRTVAERQRTAQVAVLTMDEFLRQTLNGRDRLPPRVEVEQARVNTYTEFADAWVVWRGAASRRRTAPVPRGLDAFHLVKRGGQWRVVSVLTTRESPAFPLLAAPR
jgi:hypothetical protein